jgi:DnaJ-class molecular chaperone
VVWPYLQEVPCPACNGKAFVQIGIIEVPCPYCKGAGKVPPYKRDIILRKLEEKRKQEEAERKQMEATPAPGDFSTQSQPAMGQ